MWSTEEEDKEEDRRLSRRTRTCSTRASKRGNSGDGGGGVSVKQERRDSGERNYAAASELSRLTAELREDESVTETETGKVRATENIYKWVSV
jgi:hypothetical protein